MPRTASSPHRKRRQDMLAVHRHWLARAEAVARRPVGKGGSPHPTVKVGAVLVGRDGRPVAEASNRFAHGVDRRRRERIRDGAKSLWINCAEQIAIAEALRKRADIKGSAFYLTLEPCAVCAGIIGELRPKHVYVPASAMRRYARLKAKWKESIEVGLVKLAEAGIPVTAIDMKPRGKR